MTTTKKYQYSEKLAHLLTIILTFLGLAIHGYISLANPVNYDEIFTLFYANHMPIKSIIVSESTHPPLYYLFFKTIFFFTQSLTFVRLVHFVSFLITVYIFQRILRLLKINKTITFLFISLFVASPYFIYISYQNRMYNPGLFLMCLSIYFLIRYLHSNKIRHAYIGLLVDFIGFFTVYGYFFYLVASSVILPRCYLSRHKVPFFTRLIAFFLAGLVLLGNFTLRREDVRGLIANISHPNLTNVLSLPAYLLGFSQPVPIIWNMNIYYFTSLLLFILFVYVTIFFIKQIPRQTTAPIGNIMYQNLDNIIHQLFAYINRFNPDQAIYIIIIINLAAVPAVVLLSLVQGISVLQPRQLFSVALMLYIGLAIMINCLSTKRPAYRIVIFVAILSLVTFFYQCYRIYWYPNNLIYSDAISGYTQNKDLHLSKNIFIDDLYALYYVCGASSFNWQLINQSCNSRLIHTLNPKTFNQTIQNPTDKEGIMTTIYISDMYVGGTKGILNLNMCQKNNSYTYTCRLKDIKNNCYPSYEPRFF